MPVSIAEFALKQVASCFDRGPFRRGVDYARQGRVELANSGWPAVAKVRGGRSYVTTVYVSDPALASRDIYGDCSCPVEIDCKHVVATALVALTRDEAEYESWEEAKKQQLVSDWLARMCFAIDDTGPDLASRNAVVYVITGDRDPKLTVYKSTRLKRGGFGRGSIIAGVSDPRRGLPSWVDVEDIRLITMLRAIGRTSDFGSTIEVHRLGGVVLEELAATGRLFWGHTKMPPLGWGPPEHGTLCWRECAGEPGAYRVELEGELLLAPSGDNHYIDPVRSRIGPLEVGVPAAVLRELLTAPPVPEAMLHTVRRSLSPLLQGDARAALAGERGEPRGAEADTLVPHVFVRLVPGRLLAPFVDMAAEAVYGADRFELGCWDPSRPMPRDMVEEGRLGERLCSLVRGQHVDYSLQTAQAALAEARFVARNVVPMLADEGWTCEFDEAFPIEPLAAPDRWIEDLQPQTGAAGWFCLELGVVIDGRKVALLPILLTAIRDGDLPIDSQLFETRDLPGMNLELPDGTLVYVSGARLQRWLRPLLELQLRGLDAEEKLVVSEFLAVDLAFEGTGRFAAGPALDAARLRVAELLELQPQIEPDGFGTELRPYQREGLAWLRFLHDAGYGGLLADDMGLGKTVQLLAFLQGLRGAGLEPATPALVVAPRSVLGHWAAEAERFAPGLAPVVHLGAGRTRSVAGLQKTSLVVTSYQTMLRDVELLRKVPWCTVLFDEAQTLKNPRAKVRRAAASLTARSRFCITGTPIENHLTELWSQIDLVMPGLLGSRTVFGAVFRRPIEKHGSAAVLELLRQRIRPFMLRRTKDTVELDLPDKVEIVERIKLDPAQRDLYESLRLSLDADVREALENRGVPGSSLTVLDAILKLRQVCCHPHLVKRPQAQKVKSSAKLERLMSMLEELVDAGRSVLVFSQFTSMLAIIERACQAAELRCLMLTGSTRDRDGVVRAFQAGDAPVFLISLKAGGTGLNLTRADTVIHYDPWWNPAAEDQATDRVHRIGQDKNVFVYKLVAAGTLEETVIEMQAEKRSLSEAALRNGGVTNLSAPDLEALYRRLV